MLERNSHAPSNYIVRNFGGVAALRLRPKSVDNGVLAYHKTLYKLELRLDRRRSLYSERKSRGLLNTSHLRDRSEQSRKPCDASIIDVGVLNRTDREFNDFWML